MSLEPDKDRMMGIAVVNNDFEEVERLAPLGIANYYESLRHAVFSENEEMIKRIFELSFEYGVPLTPEEINDVAEEFDFPELYKIYIDLFIPNLGQDKNTMMRIAAENDNFGEVERLAPLGVTDYYDSLITAVLTGSEQMIKRIIELSKEYGVPLKPKVINDVAKEFDFPKLVQIYNDVNERT